MRTALVLVCMLTAFSQTAVAQRRNIDRQIRENQTRLDSIRQEREDLETQRQRLSGQARNISSDLANLNRQQTSTRGIVNELDRQLGTLNSQLDTLTLELILVEDAMAEKEAILERRAVAIHKRGSLWAFEVLLAAESFGDLLSRYKYLYTASRQDRSLVNEITTLRNRISANRRDLVTVQARAAAQRTERNRELDRYLSLGRERQRALSLARQSEQRAATRITELEADALRLDETIAALVRARGTTRLTVATIGEDDLGKLDWPIDGRLVYRFGQEPLRDNTTIAREGIGIRAAAGTPVKAVRTGIVAQVGPFGTFGQIVILDHGGGYWTLYTQLSSIIVAVGDLANDGQIIARTGGANTDEGPHLGFQIRQLLPNSPRSVPLDPLNWLKRR
ncbi:MAG: peptidoglycan DD-metalloendopeptidase family protein [Gemmatimonadetes bacterium]|nr:peptidoglycan DD-metalloendopeptidase family protein [Gemmatimonadota bacterium]